MAFTRAHYTVRMIKLSTIVINTNTLADFWKAFLDTEISFSASGFTRPKADEG
ncbi:hypothetical protein [Arthrobacter glacialis]|uniref:hypothetical protein n=1 Tax=Arthrobacter glacialis TaxID=1664 RepID=UPI0013FD96FE|nr:hypothetical protein [Arthrobacter glacialis]